MNGMPHGKLKLTMETQSGELYELEGIAAELSVQTECIDVGTYDEPVNYINGRSNVELKFIGLGDITQRGIKEVCIVCGHCGSRWEESDPYHPGTCGNCGAYYYDKEDTCE